MFSFLANKETEHTDPVLLPSDHGPEAIPQASRVPHRTRQSVPRLINGVHITDPDIDEMIECRIVERHVVSTTIKVVLVERHQASMVYQVVHRQPLLEDVPEVLLRVFRPK